MKEFQEEMTNELPCSKAVGCRNTEVRRQNSEELQIQTPLYSILLILVKNAACCGELNPKKD